MTPELRDRLLALADEKLKLAGFGSVEEFFERGYQAIDKLGKAFENLRTRDGLVAILNKIDVPKEDEPFVIATFRYFPYLLRELLGYISEVELKRLPGSPTGRKPSLNSEQATNVCAYVASLYGKGVELRVAKQRAAQRYAISIRTVERAWHNRRAKTDDIDLYEAIAFFKGRIMSDFISAIANPVATTVDSCDAIIESTSQSKGRAVTVEK